MNSNFERRSPGSWNSTDVHLRVSNECIGGFKVLRSPCCEDMMRERRRNCANFSHTVVWLYVMPVCHANAVRRLDLMSYLVKNLLVFFSMAALSLATSTGSGHM
ncbi:hypothetical protein DFP73DRAFT_524006 [Morchella snyderi]|nr:hypothetical protein DFP73DRAFT_524006 [Morchella snyderi]